MATVKLSPKYQVVIPAAVREHLRLRPGQRLHVLEKDGVVHVIPLRELHHLRGMLRGMDRSGLRDEAERGH